jgi:signal transduction histidine kinase
MPSPLDSTLPGSDAPPAELVLDHSPRPQRSLRNAVVLAFVPLCFVVIAGMFAVLLDARRVHTELQRMFEELREVALTRSLLDELHGFEQWVEAVPEARASTHPLVVTDLHHHYEAARATFGRFTVSDDPSNASHDAEERGMLDRIDHALTELASHLDTDESIGQLQETLTVALHSASILAHTVGMESREIGNELDQRSSRLTDFMLLLGLASITTVAGLGFILLRRVLVPVRELRRSARALGRGQLDFAVPIRHADELGELAATFVAMATQLRESREELEHRVEARSREVLRTARLAELGTLAAGIAHEINNPLASIATCAEGLLRDGAGATTDGVHLREYLEIIRKEAMRTRDITARLLGFARHEHGRRERITIGTELREVAPMFLHQFATAGVVLELFTDPAEPAILGDAAEWRQVLFNLLRNALDASPRGATVHVRSAGHFDRAELVVEDEGEGILAEDLERVFEPFFTTKAPGKGTGLGLAIVHRIVTSHGGSIRAENRTTGGARFLITVPVARK